MHISIKIAVAASSALLATLTIGGIVAERARTREVRATLEQESIKQQRFAEEVLRQELRTRTEQYDALRPVEFTQLAWNQPHNPDRWGACMIAFTAYESVENEEHHPGARQFKVWGLVGLGPEDEKVKQSPQTIQFVSTARAFKQYRILTSEKIALSARIIDFLDKKFLRPIARGGRFSLRRKRRIRKASRRVSDHGLNFPSGSAKGLITEKNPSEDFISRKMPAGFSCFEIVMLRRFTRQFKECR